MELQQQVGVHEQLLSMYYCSVSTVRIQRNDSLIICSQMMVLHLEIRSLKSRQSNNE